MEYTVCDKKLTIATGTAEISFQDVSDVLSANDLEEIQLPSTIKIIHDNTFFDFPGVKRINIPNGIQQIGSQAFWGLDDLEELALPITVPFVGKHAFCNCTNLTLTILGNPNNIPSGWDTEFAVNIKGIHFQKDSV